MAGELFAGGEKTWADDNLRAIELLKRIQAEQRPATPQEADVLVRYKGWGSVKGVFSIREEWAELKERLEGLLTRDEADAAANASLNAMYSPPDVVGAMWDALRRFGFTGGRVLEPAAGVGHFYGLMPADMRAATRRVAVELDPISGGILRLLYPDTDVRIAGFQEAALPNEAFDLVISNVPFGDYGVFDRHYPAAITGKIHDHFFVRAADLLRPHAVMAFITSHGTLDKLNAHVRNVLAEKLDFLGAIRLNDSSLPRTKVIADIIFFRRRARGDPLQTEPRWRESREVEVVPGGPYRDPVMRSWNEYYHDHPEMVLGKVELGSQYGPSRGPTDITVRPSSEAPLGDQLRAAVARLPENVMELAEDRPAIPEPLDLIPSPENLPGRGELALIDGGLHRNTEEGARNIEAELMAGGRGAGRTVQRVKGVIGLRDRLLRLLREQLQAESEEEYASQLDDLRQAYDKFVRKNRGVRTAANMRPFRTLGDLWTPTIVAGLEEVDPGTGETRPGPVFTRRVLDRPAPITRVDTPTDAIPVLLNESGGLDRRRLAELTALPEQHAVAELVEAGAAYEDPSGRLVVAEEYLSGDVVGKLQAARAAAELDARYRANVLALEKVQPQPLEAEEIDVSLGAPWVPAEVVENFVDELIGDDAGTRNLQIRYSPEAGRWLVGDANYIAGSVIGREEWGTPDVPMPRLVSDTLNVITPTVKRTVTQPDGSEKREVDWPATEEIRAKQKELQTRWRDWIWADAGRIERLVPLYNETYNNLVPRRYDGSWLTFPTMAPWARDALRDFQRRSVARILHDRRALLFHAPGAGKTWVMVAGAVEGRRLGTIRKSIIVVPRQVLDQAADTARALYPAGRFLLVQPEDLAPRKIDGTLVQMALGETWDAILMTKEGFKRIPMSRANVQEYLGKRLAELEQAITDATEGQVDRNQIRRMRTARMNLDTRLLRMLADVEQHEGLTFEQLGVDMVMYDESQYAKNAPFTTQMERVRGLGNSQGNELTFDLMMKGLYLSRLHNGAGGMVFSSGTPVTNSIVEMYTLMRYLSPMELEADGINHLDGWVQQFGEITEEAERKAYGKYVPESRLRRFKNVSPELLTRFWRFADVVTFDELAEILGSNIPKIALNSKGERTWEDVILESTVHHRRVFRGLQQTAQWIKEHYRAAMEQGMPMLTVYTDMRKAGIDLRYLDPSMPDLPGSKLSVAAGKIAEIYHRTAKDRLTQAVFLNMGIPSPEARAAGEFIPYDELLRKLLLLEVNPAEIAMMPDYGLKQLPELFARVNAGEIRVLIGSLERMGVGVNIQQRLIAEHLLDPPYRPDLVEQGLRRGVRHGNINPEVELYRYATKGSGDEDMYFINATKWAFYNQLMRGDLAVRAFDDLQTDTMSFAQISAAVSENPVIRELIEAQHELQRLQHLEVAHVRAQRRLAQEIRSREAEIGHAGELQAMHAEIARLAKVEPFGVVVAGRRCHKHKETGEALKRHAMAPEWTRAADRWDPIGELLGVPLLARPVFSEPGHRRLPNAMQVLFEPERSVRPGAAVQLGLDTNPTFLATGLAAVVKRSAGEEAAAQERMELLGREQSAAQGRIGLPFGEREALAEQARVVGDLERQVQSYEDSQGEPDGLERYASPVVDDVRSALAQSSAAYQALEDELAELETAEPLTDPWKEDPMAHRGWQERMANLSDQMDTLVLEELHRRDGAGEADVPKEDPEPFSVAPVAPAAHPRVRSASRRSDRIAYYMRHGLGVELPPEMERHIRTSDAPAFGMGAMAVIPDPRNPWKRTFDRIRDRMLSLPRGSRRHAFVNYVGRGLWGLRFGVGDEQWIRLSRVPGAWKLSSEDAGAINRRITDKMADLERHCGPEEAQATNQLLADVMDGVRPVEDLPPDLHDLYTTYKGIMDEMLDELEALTWLHPHLAAFGLRNVMDIIRLRRGGRGVYLRRLYQVGDPSRAGGEKEYRRGTTRRPNGRFRLMTNYRLRGGMWKHRRSDADSDLALWTVQHADGTFTQTPDPDAAMEVYEREIETNLKRYGQSVYDRVKLLDPFDQTVVEKLGPVRDVRVRIARTLTDMRHNLEVLKLFDYLDMTVALDQPPDDPAEDYERLMAHPTMGPLSGKWVPGPIAHALTAMERVNNSLPWQAWDLFNNSWKYGHVVVNLPTWMNNLFGLSYSWALDRLTPASDLRWFREAFIAMRDRTQPWRDLVAANRINVGFSHEIANAMLKQLEYGDRDLPSLLSEWIHNVARRAGLSEGQMAAMDRGLVRAKRGAATLGRLYDYPDQVSIMASYLKKRHEGMSHEEALRNLWMYPNYAEPGQYARWARKTPFGATFVMFTEQWAKISIKAMRNVPGTLLALYLLPGLLALFTRIYLGITDEEMAVINTDPRRSGSPWRRYMMPILPVRDREGRLLMADLRWKIPGGDDLRFLGLDGGLDIPWVLSTPATQLFGELASRRELYTGREIWKRTDSNPVKLWKGFKHVVKDVVPLPRMATHGAVRVMRTAEDGDFNELMRVLALHEWADCVWPGLTSQANVPPGTNERMERGYATYLMRVHVENELRRTLSPAAWARMFAPEVVRSRIVPAGTNASLEAGYQAYVRNHAAQQQMRSQAHRDQIAAGNLAMRGAELDFARQRAREEQALSRSLEEFAANVEEAVPPVPAPPAPEYQKPLDLLSWAERVSPGITLRPKVPRGTNERMRAGYQAYLQDHQAKQQQMRSQAYRDQISAGNLPMRGAELDFARQRAREEQALSRSLEEFAANEVEKEEAVLEEDVLQWAEMLLAFLEADLPSDPMLTREEFTRRIYPGPREKSLRA